MKINASGIEVMNPSKEDGSGTNKNVPGIFDFAAFLRNK